MSSSSRDIFFDQLKGISIFGVVYIHSLWLLDGSHKAVSFVSDFFRLAVPIFIVIFSFFLEKAIQKRNYKEFFSRRLLSLLYPFLFWSLLYFFMSANFSELLVSPEKLLTTYFSGYGWAGQYFFILCFQVLLIFPIIRTMTYKSRLFPIAVFLLTLTAFLYLTYRGSQLPSYFYKVSDRAVFYWLPYICLGIILASHPIRKHSKWCLFFISLTLSVPLEYLFLGNNAAIFSPYTLVSVLISTCLASTILFTVKPTISGFAGSVLSLMGRNSMAIFVMNPLLINTLGFVVPRNYEQNEATNFIIAFCLVVIVCFASLSLAQLLKNTRLGKVIG